MSNDLSAPKAKHRAASERRQRLLYRRGEVAAMLGISVSTVARMQKDGRLPGHKLGPEENCQTLYRAADVYRLAGITPDDATDGIDPRAVVSLRASPPHQAGAGQKAKGR